MVLDDPSPAGSTGFSDDAPDSDVDPYSSTGYSNAAVLDPSQLPRPFPILGPLFGFNGQLLSTLVHKRIEAGANLLGRPATEDEATAIAYWTAKQIAVTSWGPPLGIAAAAWRTYQTADAFRFPFYKPNPATFNSLTWPLARAALLSGPRAVAAWHGTRLLAYGLLGSAFGRMILASYGMSVTMVGEIRDPRLKSYVEAARKAAQNAGGMLPNESQKLGKVGNGQGKGATTTWEDSTGEIGDSTNADAEEYGDTKTGERLPITRDAIMPDPNMKPRGRMAQSSRETDPKKANEGTPRFERQPRNSDENFEDASPSEGQETEDNVVAEGSAWERIRRHASGRPAGARKSSTSTDQAQQVPRPDQRAWRRDGQRHSREGPLPGDRVSHSKSDEERQLTRDEAQKVFDARVEQERRGGDFSADNNGDQKRW